MKVLACSAAWVSQDGAMVCPGTLQQVDADLIPQGISLEEARELSGHVIGLFAVIAAVLLIQRAIR